MNGKHSTEAKSFRQVWRTDLLASVVVFLVALPLCMGIAIASGMPPATGLITGIVGGLVVGSMSGAPLLVSGPAAGLSVLVWDLVQEHGVAMLGVIVLQAGLIQTAAGLLKLGQWFRAVSPAVIMGMLAGIGVLIFASQFHVMVDDEPKGDGLTNLISIPGAVWKGLTPPDGSAHHLAAYLGVLTIATIGLWKSFAPARLKAIPAPLVAVVLATAAATILGFPARGVRCVELPDNMLTAIRWIEPQMFWHFFDTSVLVLGFSMALVASAETLLSAVAVDKMHTGPRAKYDRELAAQGIGNMLCGVMGALPMTGVIVRSAANVQAGARTRFSTILHGVWLLSLVVLLPQVLETIPTSSLAAVLVYTGYKLVNPASIRQLASHGRSEVMIYAATVVTIVAVNLLVGILLGFGLSLAKLIYTFTHLNIRQDSRAAPGMYVLHLSGSATFLRLPKLADALEAVPPGMEVHLHVEELNYIDHACLELLASWERQQESTGGSLVIDWDNLTARLRSRTRASGAARQGTRQRKKDASEVTSE